MQEPVFSRSALERLGGATDLAEWRRVLAEPLVSDEVIDEGY